MNDGRLKGPIEILCDEIGFEFSHRIETSEMLVAFVGVLVWHISDMREMAELLGKHGGKAPTAGSARAIEAAFRMLETPIEDLINASEVVHNLCHELNPEEGPCDHLIDMISSCASVIRFGLEKPCKSRHAASAADHVWRHKYGLKLFDHLTGNWQRDWTRHQMQMALINMTTAKEK